MKSAVSKGMPVCLILCAGALGIFLIPWYVPVKEPAMTQSYTYGFNNPVAILAVGATLGALFLYLLFRWRVSRDEVGLVSCVKETFALSPDSAGDKVLLPSFLAASILFGGLVLACYCYTPFYRFGEMGYFLSRLEYIVIGRRPYYDFAFSYGPAMLYLPFYLYRASHGMLSLEQAYCVILILFWIAGLYALSYCVRMLFPRDRCLVAFWTFALIVLNPTLGLQYTHLRFVLPVATLLFAYSATSGGRYAHARVAIAAFLATFLNFECSPEMGLSVTLALLIYFIALLRTPSRAYSHGALFALLGAAAAILPWSARYLDIFFSFGGGRSLPIFPGPGMLLFLLAIFLFLPRFAVLGFVSSERSGAASLSFSVFCGILIDAALTRCDLGHVFVNGLGVFLAGTAVLSRLSDARWFRGFLAALFLIFAVVGEWLFLFHYAPFFKKAAEARAWMRANPTAAVPASCGFLFSKRYPPMKDLDALLGYGTFATPLGCPENIERFLLLHGDDATPLNAGNYDDVFTQTQTGRAIEKLETERTILVPKALLASGPSADDEWFGSDYRFLRNQALIPIRLVRRHPYFDPQRIIANRIVQEFSVIGEVDDCVIMVRGHASGQ